MTDLSAQDVAAAMGLNVPQSSPRKTSSTSSPTSDLRDIRHKEETQGEREYQDFSKQIEESKKTTDDEFKQVQEARLAALQSTQNRPQLKQTDPLESFFSLGSVFGILASAATHTPWYNGVNAAAAAINARNQGDMETYQEKLKEWRENTDNMFKLYDMERDEYNMIRDTNKDNIANMDSKLRQHYALWGNEAGLAYQEAGLGIQEADLAMKRQQNAVDLRKKYIELNNAISLDDAQRNVIAAYKSGDATAYGNAVNTLDVIKSALAPSLTAKDIDSPKPAEVKTADGKTQRTNVVYSKTQGRWLYAEGHKPVEGDVTITKEETGGGRAQTMLQRQLIDASDIVKDVKNVMELPITASTGWFGFGERKGILDVTKAALVNSTVTTQEVQDFNAQLSGMGRALAGLETGGLQANQGLVHSFEGLALNAGDTQVTKLRKLALMRQYTQNALEAALTNPLMSQKEQDYANGLLKELSDSIPFTVHDVTSLEQSKNPQETISDVAKSQGLSGGPMKPNIIRYDTDGNRIRTP